MQASTEQVNTNEADKIYEVGKVVCLNTIWLELHWIKYVHSNRYPLY